MTSWKDNVPSPFADLEAYNEKLLDGDIEKYNKIVELQNKNEELKKRNAELAGQKASLGRWFGEAKEIIRDLLSLKSTASSAEDINKRFSVRERAEQFLEETDK